MIDVLSTIEGKNFKACFKPSRRKQVKKVFVEIEGELNISYVEELKKAFQEALLHYDILAIQLTNIQNIDVPGVQLLHMLSSSVLGKNKVITIDSEFSEEDKSLLSVAGFSTFLNKPKLVH